MTFWTDVLAFCQSTTARVGERLLGDFGATRASRKLDGSLVTESDLWADEALREAVTARFPDHGLLTEESEHVYPDREWCWAIDPIDGTTNFARGLPLWAISLGLLHNGTSVFGYVHVPLVRQSFHGYWRGFSELDMPDGAYCNGEPIHASLEPLSRQQFVSLCSRCPPSLHQDVPCKVRMLGVATYNLLGVASGAILGAVETRPKIWDIAATWAIVQAAGGTWVPLGPHAPFPLRSGVDYAAVSYPTLALAHPALGATLEPLVRNALAG